MFIEKIGIWEIYSDTIGGHIILDNGYYIDHTIYYPSNGRIAYDNPAKIPNNIKKYVEKLYGSIIERKGRNL